MSAQCDPSSTNTDTTTFIDNFTTTNGTVNISNTGSGLSPGHYVDNFATTAVSNYATASFDFSVVIQGGTVGCAIWVDWNGDLTFDTPGEVVYNTTSYSSGPFTGTITIPPGTSDGDYYMRVMIDWVDSNPNDDACALNSGRGEVEDYKVTVDASLEPACLPPNSLTATPTNLTEATLGWVEAGTATLWDVEIVNITATGTATGIPTATGVSNPYSVTMLTAGNDYEYYVRADCGIDGTSAWAGPFAWRQSVFGDTCALPIDLTVEADCNTATPYTIDYATAVDIGSAGSCDTTMGNTGAWFEFTAPASGALTVNTSGSNEIAIFDACGGTEIVCNSVITISQTIVGLTPSAVYKLAVWRDNASTGTTDVCLEEVACPNPSALTVTAFTDTTATLAWIENGTASVWNIEWGAEGFTQGAGTVITGTTTNPYDLAGLTANTSYDFYVQSDCGSSTSDWVGPFNFFTGYCIPSGTSTSTYINNFSTTNGSVNISNLASGLAANNYQDNYSAMTVSGIQNGTFDFNIGIVGGTVGCAIWIDWNNNLIFDVSEAVYSSAGYGSGPFTGTVTIPSGVANGDYRMRVMIDWNDSNPGDDTACSIQIGRGEVEDYKVTVDDGTLSTGTVKTKSLFKFYPNPVDNKLTLKSKKNIEIAVVYNVLGKEVLKLVPNAINAEIDMSNLVSGVYFVKVTVLGSTETIRILKN